MDNFSRIEQFQQLYKTRGVILLEDVLAPNLKILFCGTAVGNKSASTQTYYASPTNKFWHILYKVRLTPRQLERSEYDSVSTYGLGLTDLAKKKQGMDKKLNSSDFDRDALILKVKKYKPQVLCFNGKKAAKEFFGEKNVKYGFQDESLGSTKIFVTPSTSGAANAQWDEKWWFVLSDSVGSKFKRVTSDNYYKPDEICKFLGNLDVHTGQATSTTEIDFVNAVSGIELHYSIPLEIRNMFELSKALFAYGYLYYQFCSLAFEQGLKSLEALITYIYNLSGGSARTKRGLAPGLKYKIDYLFNKGNISEIQKERLNVYRNLRNMSFHPEYQQVLGHYVGYLEKLAEIMNEIWVATRV